MAIRVLPIAGGKVIFHCYCSISPNVLCFLVVDYDCSLLPIVGRPATIK